MIFFRIAGSSRSRYPFFSAKTKHWFRLVFLAWNAVQIPWIQPKDHSVCFPLWNHFLMFCHRRKQHNIFFLFYFATTCRKVTIHALFTYTKNKLCSYLPGQQITLELHHPLRTGILPEVSLSVDWSHRYKFPVHYLQHKSSRSNFPSYFLYIIHWNFRFEIAYFWNENRHGVSAA